MHYHGNEPSKNEAMLMLYTLKKFHVNTSKILKVMEWFMIQTILESYASSSVIYNSFALIQVTSVYLALTSLSTVAKFMLP